MDASRYFFCISAPQHFTVPVTPLVTITCAPHLPQRYIFPSWLAINFSSCCEPSVQQILASPFLRMPGPLRLDPESFAAKRTGLLPNGFPDRALNPLP